MYQKYIKRSIDFILAIMAIIFLSPLLLITSIIVRIKLGSPVIFKQKRPGKNEKVFTLYKFRSMSDKKDEKGNLLSDEERLGKTGKLIRSLSLDELPSLINIIKGDMSIVGPRPLLVEYLPLYNKEQRHRHDVRPGLTGLAQVNGRNLISWEEKFRYDIKYVNNISFLGDIRIIMNTIKKLVIKEGIHSETSVTMEKFCGKRLIIIGASGHGKVIADIAENVGYDIEGFLDDDMSKKDIMGYPVLGTTQDIGKFSKGYEFVIAIGNNQIRRQISEKHETIKWAILIHPKATIGKNVNIGKGTVVMANATINPDTTIGNHCIINTGSIVEHDNCLEDYVHISPNATLGGTVNVGIGTHIGIGSVLKNNITVCKDCIIGAGGVVVKDIQVSGVYMGVPVKLKG